MTHDRYREALSKERPTTLDQTLERKLDPADAAKSRLNPQLSGRSLERKTYNFSRAAFVKFVGEPRR